MTRRTFINATILLLIILPFTACKFSYEEIIDEINSSFSPEHKDTTLAGLGYDTTKLIPSSVYNVNINNVLMIEAPKGCEKYTWKVVNSKTSSEGKELVNCTIKNADWEFRMKITENDFVVGEANQLVLVVKDTRGATYSDDATVYVFK